MEDKMQKKPKNIYEKKVNRVIKDDKKGGLQMSGYILIWSYRDRSTKNDIMSTKK